jgi:diguanylate cyclase (GGDEF)-like protein
VNEDQSSDFESAEVVYDWDLGTDAIKWGPNVLAVTGIRDVESISTGLGYAELLAAESPSSRYEAIMASSGCDTGGGVAFKTIYGLLPVKRSDAAPIWIEDAGRWFADARDRPGRVRGIIRVITERYEAERLITASAQRDGATGAFNRAHFIEHVGRQISLSARKTSTFAILVIGLERADQAGNPLADETIAAAVSALSAEMRGHELLARHASTKLAVLLENCNAEQAEAAATRFLGSLATPATDAPPLFARIGAVIAPFHGRTPPALLQFAEEALEIARMPESPPFVVYRPNIGRPVVPAALTASDQLLSALEEGRVALALQPVVHAATRQPAFYEGLVRIKLPDGQLILPDRLVPDAERNGLVPLIDRRVIDIAFALLTADRKLSLSINASVTSLHDTAWLEQLRACCRLRPDAARRLTVEITETCVISDLDAMVTVLGAIKQLGVKIAVDDFGSGHSSFRNLRGLPLDYLKIDGVFAQNLASSPDDRFFIRTLIDLARNLKIPTVAEWVEDEETAKILADWGVNYMQGHLFGKAEVASIPGQKSRPTPE